QRFFASAFRSIPERNEGEIAGLTARSRQDAGSAKTSVTKSGLLYRRVHRPEHAERIAKLAVAIAPEHRLDRHDNLHARIDRTRPPGVDVVHDELHREALRLFPGMAVVRIGI